MMHDDSMKMCLSNSQDDNSMVSSSIEMHGITGHVGNNISEK